MLSLFNQVIHSGAAPVPCHVCGKEFALKADMRRHLRGHKQGCFKCNVCPAVFANLTHWDNHMNETHPGMPKVRDHDMIPVSKHPPHNIRACYYAIMRIRRDTIARLSVVRAYATHVFFPPLRIITHPRALRMPKRRTPRLILLNHILLQTTTQVCAPLE